jgi:hypothetical protein
MVIPYIYEVGIFTLLGLPLSFLPQNDNKAIDNQPFISKKNL